MKKLKYILGAIILGFGVMSCTPAMAFGTPLVKPDAYYEIDTYGSNSDVYDFTPKSAPHMTCTSFLLDDLNAMGVDCYLKLEYQLYIAHPEKYPNPKTGKIDKW